MNTTYSQSEDTGTFISKGLLAFLATGIIFSLLPILQIIPGLLIPEAKLKSITLFDERPPEIVEPIPEKPKEKPKLDKPEIEKPLPKPTLTEIEALFHVGTGSGGISYSNNLAEFINIGDDLKIFDLNELERKPRALFQVEPVFPYDLKNQRIEGWVLLEWVITDRGRVSHIKAIQYSHREFVSPAIDSISKSKWEPGEISSKPVNSRVRQKITFNL